MAKEKYKLRDDTLEKATSNHYRAGESAISDDLWEMLKKKHGTEKQLKDALGVKNDARSGDQPGRQKRDAD